MSSRLPIISLFFSFLLVGCMTAPPGTRDVDELLEAYRAHSKKISERQKTYLERGIKHLEVIPDAPGSDDFLVSLDLKNARLATVISRLVRDTGFEYSFGGSRLAERVTARFERRSLLDALKILLGQAGYRAIINDGVILIEQAALPHTEKEFGGKLQIEVPLKYIDTTFAQEFLEELYSNSQDEKLITFAMNPARNTVFLSGRVEEVREAAKMLEMADSDSGHVLIEILVVEFNTEALRNISANIIGAARRELSDIDINFSALAGKTISFTHVADALNVNRLSALLNLLIEDRAARVISRPYLATLSNEEATLDITEDRFVTVQLPGGLDASLEKVSSGVEMEVKPIVQVDGMIRLEIRVSESKFTGGGLNTNSNNIETVTRVGDGETVIIGGLMLNYYSSSDSGLPGLRDVPAVGVLFGDKRQGIAHRQVMIYVTPHLWVPGTESPLLRKDLAFVPGAGADHSGRIPLSAEQDDE